MDAQEISGRFLPTKTNAAIPLRRDSFGPAATDCRCPPAPTGRVDPALATPQGRGRGSLASPTEQPALTRADLISPVRRLLGSGRATVTTWQVHAIRYAALNLAERRLFRVSGQAEDQGTSSPGRSS
jgi:hypothetical protein